MNGESRAGLQGRPMAALAVLAIVVMLATGVRTASAAIVHPLLSSFEGGASPAESFTLYGLGVDNSSSSASGDVYVTDASHKLIDRYSSSGKYLGQITGTPSGSFQGPYAQDAVGPSGELFVGDTFAQKIDEYSASGAYLGQASLKGNPYALAANPAGEVLAASYTSEGPRLEKWDPASGALSTFASGTPAGAFGFSFGVAVDDDPSSPSYGDVYIASGSPQNVVAKFSPAGAYVSQLSATPAGHLKELGRLAVDPATGDLYVTSGKAIYEFGPTGSYIGSITLPSNEGPTGIAVNGATGDLYAGKGDVVDVFGPAVFAPTVTLGAASGIGATEVTLHGEVEPAGGLEVTACDFEYGTSTTFDHSVACAPGAPYAEKVVVSGRLEGLAKDTVYHYRLAASDKEGGDHTESGSFETFGPPSIEGEASSGITRTGATLHGKIDPHGLSTTYRFEYGRCESAESCPAGYEASVPVPPGAVGSAGSAQEVSQEITGLALGSTYHYRLVAENTQGSIDGADQRLETEPAARIDGEYAIARIDSAKLEVEVNPLGLSTSCELQYLPEAEYARSGWKDAVSMSCAPQQLGSGSSDVTAAIRLYDLQRGVPYEYRFVVANSSGTNYGAPRTFATFGIEAFTMEDINAKGEPEAQAGGHPYELRTQVTVNTTGVKMGGVSADALIKDVLTQLPVGMVGDPNAAAKCARRVVEEGGCPNGAQVGVIEAVTYAGTPPSNAFHYEAPLYNTVAPKGSAAEFASGAMNDSIHAFIGASVRTGEDYGVTAGAENITELGPVVAVTVTMWGVPAEASHDPERYCGANPVPGGCASSAPLEPFLSNPTACDGQPMLARVAVDSYQAPGEFVHATHEMQKLMGCGKVRFTPSIAVTPESSAADSATGLRVDLHVPQQESVATPAEADLKDAKVILPVGVTLNPAAARGLQGCPLLSGKQAHPGVPGIDMEDAEAAKCPEASKVGSVELITPLVGHPLDGAIYVAQQSANPFGTLLALYIAISDPQTGVVVKLAGHVHLDAATGQLTTTFDENPQLPFEELRLEIFGGPRAPLATPRSCGAYTTTSSLEPWSHQPAPGEAAGTPDGSPVSAFQITSGPGGSACAASPFAPAFAAGTVDNQAGAFSPFVMNLARQDGEQRLSSVEMTMPPGISGMLSKVALCDEADANAGTCPASSEIGHVVVNAGVGSEPITLPEAGKGEDPVYITEKYDGAPFGLSIVVPAEAGPFNLGKVIVRARIEVNPTTAQVTVISNPMPAMLQGIPLDVQAIHVSVNRAGFMFNPTSCEPMSVAGTIGSQEGASAAVSSRFQAAGCRGLAFKPHFSALIHAHHSRKDGEYLHVQVRSAFGQANIGKVHVQLPGKLPSRLETLKLACTEAQFAANPAGCPAGSFVGHATAHTPILPVPMQGPAIFVSHGGKGFPNLDLVLQGDGVHITLVGDTFINKKQITTSTFSGVPDVPIGRFDLVLPAGPHSALAGTGNVCSGPLYMPTTLTGQNGAVVKHKTRIMVTGCKPEIRVVSHKAKGKRALVRVKVPSAGRLVASGPGLTRSVVHTGKAQVVRIAAALDGRDRRVLARNRHERVNATVKLSFVPQRNRRDPLDAQVKVLIG